MTRNSLRSTEATRWGCVMTGWADAVEAADRLQEEHPGWRVRAVPRRDGPGVAAVRNGSEPGLCMVIGTEAEVRTALAATTTIGSHQ